jgi:cyclopropane fatty-acyl-phospholipid synthase-like methyltransferase
MEPELMLDTNSVSAFYEGKKDYGIKGFLELYKEYVNISTGTIIDLGSGTGEYLIALEKQYPGLKITGYDGSEHMVRIAQSLLEKNESNINIHHKNFNDIEEIADCVISTNTLHHIHDYKSFWKIVKKISNTCFIFDFLRPENTYQAESIVNFYARNESELFKKDYYNSLLAAFSLEEVKEQIEKTSLKFKVIHGKHPHAQSFIVYGNI